MFLETVLAGWRRFWKREGVSGGCISETLGPIFYRARAREAPLLRNLSGDFEKPWHAAIGFERERGGIFEHETEGAYEPFGCGLAGGAGHGYLADDAAELELIGCKRRERDDDMAPADEFKAAFIVLLRHGFGGVDEQRSGMVAIPVPVLDQFDEAFARGFGAFGFGFEIGPDDEPCPGLADGESDFWFRVLFHDVVCESKNDLKTGYRQDKSEALWSDVLP